MKSLLSILALASLAALGAAAILAQTREPREARSRLDLLRASIAESEGRLKGLDSAARRSASAIDEYRREAAALDTLIDALQGEETRREREMILLHGRRDSLRDDLSRVKGEYALAARSLLKRRLMASGGSALLLPAEQLELALRGHLFERYARRQSLRAKEIVKMSGVLAAQDSLLRTREREQLALIEEKRSRIERLIALQREGMASLAGTDARREELRKEIERKNGEAAQIAAMIEKMARQEAEKKESLTRSGGTAPSGRAIGSAGDTKPRKGRSGPLRFSWPTSGRGIAEGYGERTNPETGTVTLNPGINIDAPAGADVAAAEDGTVSLVSWLPSFGTIVIVEHRGGYRTVYGNLAGVSVSRGASVAAGERIGTVGRAEGAAFLHFEVWQGGTRLNPATVLR